MDPEAALTRLRELAEEIIERIDADESYDHLDDLPSEMAETFQGLDQWITRGGFLPRDWKPTQKVS